MDCATPPIPLTCIPVYVNRIISALIAMAGGIGVILIIVGAIQWITSGGDPKAMAKARATLTYAIIGLSLVFMSFLILSVLGRILGINLLNIGITF